MTALRVRLRLDFDSGGSLGPGKIELLESIARTGSLSGAARALRMSYRRAWLLLHSVNESFDRPAVELSVGGRQGGGAELTPFGTELIYAYRNLEAELQSQASHRFARVAARSTRNKGAALPARPLSRKTAAPPRRRKASRR
jgi:molybdate transport system regulatory protein